MDYAEVGATTIRFWDKPGAVPIKSYDRAWEVDVVPGLSNENPPLRGDDGQQVTRPDGTPVPNTGKGGSKFLESVIKVININILF